MSDRWGEQLGSNCMHMDHTHWQHCTNRRGDGVNRDLSQCVKQEGRDWSRFKATCMRTMPLLHDQHDTICACIWQPLSVAL